MFRSHYLSDVSGFASEVTSAPIPMGGNYAALAVLVINAVDVVTGTFEIQGSYDGQTWVVIASLSQNAFGYASTTASGVDHAFLRVAARVSSTGACQILFDATLAISLQQGG